MLSLWLVITKDVSKKPLGNDARNQQLTNEIVGNIAAKELLLDDVCFIHLLVITKPNNKQRHLPLTTEACGMTANSQLLAHELVNQEKRAYHD